MRGMVLLAAALALLLRPAPAAAAEAIGDARQVIATVHGSLSGAERRLAASDPVFHEELIATEAGSASRLVFRDGTELSIGPLSRVTLDRFVYDPDPTRQQLAIALAKGVLRFATGRLGRNAYLIVTPSATVGVRGTVFTVTVDDEGGTTIAVEEGRVRAASPQGAAIEIVPGAAGYLGPARGGVFPLPVLVAGLTLYQVTVMDELLAGRGSAVPEDPANRPDIDYRNRGRRGAGGGQGGGGQGGGGQGGDGPD